jgi:hypothetical protein
MMWPLLWRPRSSCAWRRAIAAFWKLILFAPCVLVVDEHDVGAIMNVNAAPGSNRNPVTGRYECPDCDKSFSKASALTRHRNNQCCDRRKKQRVSQADSISAGLGNESIESVDDEHACHNAHSGEDSGEMVLPGGEPLPQHVVPGHVILGQVVPGQVVPGQVVPGQMVPGQMVPGQMVPGQMVPGQMVPGQMAPMPVNIVHQPLFVKNSCPLAMPVRLGPVPNIDSGDDDENHELFQHDDEEDSRGGLSDIGEDAAPGGDCWDELVDVMATGLLAKELEDESNASGHTIHDESRTHVMSDDLNKLLYEDAGITVLQATFLMLQLKREGRIRDNVFDMVCRVIHEVLLPQGNLFPQSLHRMKKLLGCRRVEDVSVHVCVNDCMSFGNVSDINPMASVDEKCTECGEDKYRVGGDGKLQPRKTFQYLGVTNAIKRLFANPDFVALRGKGRDEPGGYYASEECKRLHYHAGVELCDPSASVYEIGLDWGQVYDKAVHSMGIVVLRCADLPSTHRSQRRFCMPLALIPGPREPRNLWIYLMYVADEFAGRSRTFQEVADDFCQSRQLHASVRVQPCGDVSTSFNHTFLLGAVYGDTPAQKKVSCSLGHGAYLACHFCCMRGVRGPAGTGMYFPVSEEGGASYGFFSPNERKTINEGQPDASTARPCKVGDSCTKLDHLDCVARANAVQDGSMQPSDVGCKAFSGIIKWLPYLDYLNTFPVPVAHASLQGVARMLIGLTIDALSNADKRIVRRRASDMREPSDVGRRYKCILSKLGNYTMEDIINFVEFGCVHILHGVLDDGLAAIWNSFRKGILYFLRERRVTGVVDNAEDAHASLFHFGELLFRRYGVTACRYNLHIMLCRLVDQERQCGLVRYSTEFWVEMMVQLAKSSVRYRTTRYPEKLLAADWCTDEALDTCKVAWPNAGLKTFDEWLPSVRSNQHRGERLDTGDAAGNLLLGNGRLWRKWTAKEKEMAIAALKTCIRDFSPRGWSEEDVEQNTFSMTLYQYADLQTFQNVHSRAYKRATQRVSYFVRCAYEEAGVYVEYIADVHFFVLATLPHVLDSEQLRMGVCDLYRLEQIQRTIGTAWKATYPERKSHSSYGVRLCDMQDKMVFCKCDTQHCTMFLEYGSVSGTGRFGKAGVVAVGDDDEMED